MVAVTSAPIGGLLYSLLHLGGFAGDLKFYSQNIHGHRVLEMGCGDGRVAAALAGRVAAAFVRTRGGAGGVGGASTATGAGIAAGGRLADQGADGAICWRSIDGWLLGAPMTDAAPGAARRLFRAVFIRKGLKPRQQCVKSRHQCDWIFGISGCIASQIGSRYRKGKEVGWT